MCVYICICPTYKCTPTHIYTHTYTHTNGSLHLTILDFIDTINLYIKLVYM